MAIQERNCNNPVPVLLPAISGISCQFFLLNAVETPIAQQTTRYVKTMVNKQMQTFFLFSFKVPQLQIKMEGVII
jgi:hypothetical protein